MNTDKNTTEKKGFFKKLLDNVTENVKEGPVYLLKTHPSCYVILKGTATR